jgi:hypothetical protein
MGHSAIMLPLFEEQYEWLVVAWVKSGLKDMKTP